MANEPRRTIAPSGLVYQTVRDCVNVSKKITGLSEEAFGVVIQDPRLDYVTLLEVGIMIKNNFAGTSALFQLYQHSNSADDGYDPTDTGPEWLDYSSFDHLPEFSAITGYGRYLFNTETKIPAKTATDLYSPVGAQPVLPWSSFVGLQLRYTPTAVTVIDAYCYFTVIPNFKAS